MNQNTYAKIVSIPYFKVAETPAKYHFFSENHLQVMWLTQKYFSILRTSDEKDITIISPGIWNAEKGPDFLRAHLKIGSEEFRGDVEIHLHDRGWQNHHHDEDERYENVILHISFYEPKEKKVIRTNKGRIIPQAYVEPFLTVSSDTIVKSIDLDLYPYRKFQECGQCHEGLFKKVSSDKIVSLLRNAAEWRLLQKREYLSRHLKDPKDQLLAGMAMALGYKNNSEIFYNLFLQLHQRVPRKEEEWLALAMHACDFFEESYQKKWEANEMYRTLLRRAPKNVKPKFHLNLGNIRPLNHPLRRLVLLAKMLADPLLPALYDSLISLWNQNKPLLKNPKYTGNKLVKQFRELLLNYSDFYWNHHFNFEGKYHDFVPLAGDDLKTEIIINAFLPLLYHHVLETKNEEEKSLFWKMYANVSHPKNGKIEYLNSRLFAKEKECQLGTADIIQGAFQVHKDFCRHFEASCHGCPFVERFWASEPLSTKTIIQHKDTKTQSHKVRTAFSLVS